MRPGLRAALYVIFGGLWVTGCLWLILHEFFARPGAFGPVRNPWEPGILRLHGWMAVGGMFLLGWVTARHVSERWPQTIKRPSGVAVASVSIVLALSGYALYYTTDRLHDVAAVAHEILGACGILFALLHWRRYGPRLSARRAAEKSPPRGPFPAL
jgi:hypothetical protein